MIQSKGFLKMAIIFIIFAATLFSFGVDVRGFIDSHSEIKSFFDTAETFIASLWNTYLLTMLSFVWQNVLVETLWGKINGFLSR